MLDKHPLLGPKGGPPFCNNSTHQEASGNLDERDILQSRVPVLVPSVSVVKNLPANAGDVDSMPGLGRFPGEGNGNPLHYSCLGNSKQRSLVGYSPWGRKESDMTYRLNNTNNMVMQETALAFWKYTLKD